MSITASGNPKDSRRRPELHGYRTTTEDHRLEGPLAEHHDSGMMFSFDTKPA